MAPGKMLVVVAVVVVVVVEFMAFFYDDSHFIGNIFIGGLLFLGELFDSRNIMLCNLSKPTQICYNIFLAVLFLSKLFDSGNNAL